MSPSRVFTSVANHWRSLELLGTHILISIMEFRNQLSVCEWRSWLNDSLTHIDANQTSWSINRESSITCGAMRDEAPHLKKNSWNSCACVTDSAFSNSTQIRYKFAEMRWCCQCLKKLVTVSVSLCFLVVELKWWKLIIWCLFSLGAHSSVSWWDPSYSSVFYFLLIRDLW